MPAWTWTKSGPQTPPFWAAGALALAWPSAPALFLRFWPFAPHGVQSGFLEYFQGGYCLSEQLKELCFPAPRHIMSLSSVPRPSLIWKCVCPSCVHPLPIGHRRQICGGTGECAAGPLRAAGAGRERELHPGEAVPPPGVLSQMARTC